MDAFGHFWQWAYKPLGSHLTIPAELHQELPPEGWRDREKVNAVVEASRR
jgi:hypothetical protein